jgi:hypothetical protein
MSKPKLTDTIQVGDLLHYCPIDLKEESHDIGIIYEIVEAQLVVDGDRRMRKFKIFWSRTQLDDVYFEITMERKLKQKVKNKQVMFLIRHNA